MNFLDASEKEFQNLVRLRRHFHEYPECGPSEQLNTLSCIEMELDKLKIRHVRIQNGGVLGFINEGKGNKTILLRSDTDALPIQEDSRNLKKTKKCVSKVNGASHACGHDGHMAMLLTQAKILKENESALNGSVILMFEQSEETSVEVEQICKWFEENKIKIDTCYGTHVRWDIPSGKVCINDSIAMHGFCIFRIEITGLGGHGSRPDLCHSPIDCFNTFYSQMNSQLKMNTTSPDGRFTWSIGQINAGTAENIIPDTLSCAGTFRFSRPEDGINAIKKIKSILDFACEKHGCRSTFSPEQFLPPVTNDQICAKLAQNAVKNELGISVLENHEPWMASETFSYMSNMIPSVFSFTGIMNEEEGCGANHHTPKFDMDERGLIYGTAMALSYVYAFFENQIDLSSFKKAQPTFNKFIAQLHSFDF